MLDPRAPGFLDRLDAVWRGATTGLPPLFEPGVRRYRSLAEADRDREAALIVRMRTLQSSNAARSERARRR